MKRITLVLFFAAMAITGFSKTWVVTSPGFTFSPATITIALGDSVRFQIDGIHSVVEVSVATWNNNNNTPLPGFSTPFGGGLILPDQLTEGTHFYVCMPHAGSGMKGMIIVENTTAIQDLSDTDFLKVYPNPSTGYIHILTDVQLKDSKDKLEVFDIRGQKVYGLREFYVQGTQTIDLSHLGVGVFWHRLYFGDKSYTQKVVLQ
jgi:plastocyanin